MPSEEIPAEGTPCLKCSGACGFMRPAEHRRGRVWVVCPDCGGKGRVCPHGRKFDECNACDVDSDLAYDVERERRLFGE
jgi:hypothetical protein